MLKHKYKKFNNKNILYTKNVLEKIREEELNEEKEEKEEKLKQLQEEFYPESEDEENDYDILLEELNRIKNKRDLLIFVRENKDRINNLDDKEKFLQIIQQKYY